MMLVWPDAMSPLLSPVIADVAMPRFAAIAAVIAIEARQRQRATRVCGAARLTPADAAQRAMLWFFCQRLMFIDSLYYYILRLSFIIDCHGFSRLRYLSPFH
jgi:hypothetical protein